MRNINLFIESVVVLLLITESTRPHEQLSPLHVVRTKKKEMQTFEQRAHIYVPTIYISM